MVVNTSSSNVTLMVNSTGGTEITAATLSYSTMPTRFAFGFPYTAGSPVTNNLACKNFAAFGGSKYNFTYLPDLSLPNISSYNLISDGGCQVWDTNKSIPCNTTFVTPTINFTTNEPANCAIGASSSSSGLDLNYSDMGSSRNCTGAASGEGTSNHMCTVTPQDELVYETSYIFISCKYANGNQNRTSTSGSLAVNVTSLESNGRNTIELAFRESLVSGYSSYTGQKVYARNSANNQSTGTFDKVAKKLNKIWAINRIGAYDSFVNMFNITPVFYTMEFANLTSLQLQNKTELLINATK